VISSMTFFNKKMYCTSSSMHITHLRVLAVKLNKQLWKAGKGGSPGLGDGH
jgi:hypothetical protein